MEEEKEGKEFQSIRRPGPRISHSGNSGRQSRKAMEVEYESTNSGCFGAFERRRETSKRRIERWSRREVRGR